MRYMLMAQLLMLSAAAWGGDQSALCELAGKDIVSRSSSGLAQVSNIGDIGITCRVPARPFPINPGESRNGLSAAITVYEISSDGSKTLVPSDVHRSGGGGGRRSTRKSATKYRMRAACRRLSRC